MNINIKKLNLAQIIEALGGQFDPKDKSKVKYQGVTYVVSKNQKTGDFVYFSTQNRQDNGTVFNFYKNNICSDLNNKQIINEVSCLSLDGSPQATFIHKTGMEKTEMPNIKIPKKESVEAHFSALFARINSERGISSSVLEEFRNNLKATSTGELAFPNYSFKLENGNLVSEICGYELRNGDFKGFRGKKGLWGNRAGSSQDVFIFESPFDAMSFREIYKQDGFCIALGGGFGDKQVNYLKLIIPAQQTKNIYICFNADKAGVSMAVNLQQELEKIPNLNVDTFFPLECKDWNEELGEKQPINPLMEFSKIVEEPKTNINDLFL